MPQGKISPAGATNFSTAQLAELLEAGVPITAQSASVLAGR